MHEGYLHKAAEILCGLLISREYASNFTERESRSRRNVSIQSALFPCLRRVVLAEQLASSVIAIRALAPESYESGEDGRDDRRGCGFL